MIVLLFLLLLVPAVASAQQGPGLWQAAPGTQISQCTNIGSPVANRTWCADGNNNPLYRWRVWDGTQYIAVGGDGGGVCGFSGQVTIADSATSALVTFGVPQATPDYFVVVSTVPVSGTPLGVFAWAHDQTINGFTVEISGPPLVGNVIGVNWQVSSGSCGGTGPSLPDTSVQFNNAGAFGGDSNLLWNNTLKRLQIGSLPLGTLAPGPLVVGSVAPSGTAQQAGLFQIISGTSVGAGPVTLSQDNVAVSGWSFAGADSVNAPYGGNFGVHFLGPGQARGVEIDVQNEFGDAGIGAFGQHIGLWLNRSGTYNASSAISIASQDPRGWWYGLHFAPGNAGTGTDTLIKGWGIYYFRAMPNQMIGIVPSDDNNPDDAMITVFAFDGTTEKSKLDKRGRFYSRGDDTGVTQPAFTFIDEPNTGIYMPAAGQLGLAVTGTEVFKAVTTPVTGTLTHGYITSFGTVFASLGAVINGALIYCSDCQQTNPCVGGGVGAYAAGINAAWQCGAGTTGGGGAVTGTGVAKQIAVWNSTTNLTGYTDFIWDENLGLLDAGNNTVLTGMVNSYGMGVIGGEITFQETGASPLLYVFAGGAIGSFKDGATDAGMIGVYSGTIEGEFSVQNFIGGAYSVRLTNTESTAVIGSERILIDASTAVDPTGVVVAGSTDSTITGDAAAGTAIVEVAILASTQATILGGIYNSALIAGDANTLKTTSSGQIQGFILGGRTEEISTATGSLQSGIISVASGTNGTPSLNADNTLLLKVGSTTTTATITDADVLGIVGSRVNFYDPGTATISTRMEWGAEFQFVGVKTLQDFDFQSAPNGEFFISTPNSSGTGGNGPLMSVVAGDGDTAKVGGDVQIVSGLSGAGASFATGVINLAVGRNSNSVLILDSDNHWHTSGHLPAVSNTSASSCGTTTATMTGTDMAGRVTVGATSGTSCTVTFYTAWTSTPHCVANNETTAALVRATATTTTVILKGVFTAGDLITYLCVG